MIFDPVNGNLYDDKGGFLKKIGCPFGLHPDQLQVINDRERRCSVCKKNIYSVNHISDDELRDMISRDEEICLFSMANAKNIKVLQRRGEVGVNSENYQIIQTLRSLEAMAAAQANGFLILFKDAAPPHAFGEDKFLVLQQKTTGEIWWTSDYRTSLFDKAIEDAAEDFEAYRDENWTIIRSWFYARRDQPFPLAAYAIPKSLLPDTRVFIPDLIEDVGYVFWNQGNALKIISATATWTGDDMKIDVPPLPAFVG